MAEVLLAVIKLLLMVFGLLIAYSMLKKGRNLELRGLTVLGVSFIFGAIAFAFAASRSVDFELITSRRYFLYTATLLGFTIYAYFIHLTFYEGKKSPVKPIMAILIIGTILATSLMVYAEVIEGVRGDNLEEAIPLSDLHPAYIIADLLIAGIIILSSGWRFLCARRSYNEIKDNKAVADWVKFRYKLIILNSICFLVWGFMHAIIYRSILPLYFRIIVMSIVGIAFALDFAAWGMPAWLKEFANRNYEALDAEGLPEDEIMTMMRGS
ncbi:MAG: hypothetical protein ACFFGZ_18780 [Candidatus Thorarchaeota archaeon]